MSQEERPDMYRGFAGSCDGESAPICSPTLAGFGSLLVIDEGTAVEKQSKQPMISDMLDLSIWSLFDGE